MMHKRVRITWHDIIDRLIDIGRSVDDFEAEGITPPSRATIARAAKLAAWMRDEGYQPPDRVVPDAGGGVVFERTTSRTYETICVSVDGIEYCAYVDGRLAKREIRRARR
jgi:hypothetical protein